MQSNSLADGGQAFTDWLRLRALPVWATLGFGDDGGFKEAISLKGRVQAGDRRARVQTRQLYVYCRAGELGWAGPWRTLADKALARLRDAYLRPDGASRALIAEDWSALDDRASLYDQAFVLFALAAVQRADVGDGSGAEAEAVRLRDLLLAQALPNGAMPEIGDHPYQSNAHMHLFEAAMAWAEISQDEGWAALADRIAGLAANHFIDTEGGYLREFFGPDWAPAEGVDGSLVEPGHQFEWAWLLVRHGRARKDPAWLERARKLYAAGSRGLLHQPRVAIDAMNDDLSPRSQNARLWPQTEWLKASLILAEESDGDERAARLADAMSALEALSLYFTADGLWRDKRAPDGTFVDEPAPASSLYHIMVAFDQLCTTLSVLGPNGQGPLTLA